MATNNIDDDLLRRLVESARNYDRELDDLAKTSAEAAEQAKKNSEALKVFSKGLISTTAEFSKAAINIKEGTGKYSGALDTATGAVSSLANNFGVFGKIIGFVTELFGKLASSSLKQNDALIRSYRGLSQIGEVGKSFKDIMQDIQDAGFSVDQNADTYIKMLQSAAPGLAQFAGTVSEGKKVLQSVMIDELGNAEYVLQRFGMTQEELFQRTGTFMGILAASGGMRKNQDRDLFKETKNYLEQLTLLSQITGQTKDEAEKKLQRDANDLRFQMHLSKLEASDDKKDREQAQNLRLVMAALPDELAEGAKSVIVNQGRIVDQQGVAFFQLLGNEGIAELREAIKKPGDEFTTTFAALMKKQGATIEQRFNQLGNNVAFGNDTMKDFGLTMEVFKYSNQARNIDEKKLQELRKKINDKSIKNDMDANTERQKRERGLRNAFEQFEFEVGSVVIPVINSLVDGLYAFGEALADFAFLATGGKVDIRDAFVRIETLADAQKVLGEQSEKQIKLNEKDIKLKNELKELNEKGVFNPMTGKYVKGTEAEKTSRAEIEEQLQKNERERTRGERLVSRARRVASVNLSEREDVGEKYTPKTGVRPTYAKEGIQDFIRFTGGSGDFAHFQMLDPQVQMAFVEMAKEYKQLYNEKLQINSAYRSMEEQAALDPGKNPKAEPGKSLHQRGLALDIQSDQVRALMSSGLLGRYNFNPLKDDPPHIQFGKLPEGKYGGIFSGPTSGYPAILHGDEAVVPLSSGKKSSPLSSGFDNSNEKFIETMLRMSDNIDTLVDLQRSNNNITESLLTAART